MNRTLTPAREVRHLLSIAGFFSVAPLISSLAPLLALPVISSRFGEGGWAGIAVGQSVGSVAAIAIELGWGTTGPNEVARRDANHHRVLFAASLRQRALAMVLIGPIVAAVATASSHEHQIAAALSGLAMASYGLSASWFYVGIASPARLVSQDTVPRICSTLLGTLAIVLGLPLVSLPATQLVISFAVAPLPLIWLAKSTDEATYSVSWRAQCTAMLGRIASSIYVAIPVVVVSNFTSLSTTAQFAAVDRLEKVGLTGISPLSQAIQGWIPRDGKDQEEKRMKQALWLSVIVAIVATSCFVLLGRPFAHILFAGTVDPPVTLLWAYGLALGCVIVSRTIGLGCLVPSGRVWAMTRSILCGAAAAVALFTLSVSRESVEMMAWSVATVELLVVLTSAWEIRRHGWIPTRARKATP